MRLHVIVIGFVTIALVSIYAARAEKPQKSAEPIRVSFENPLNLIVLSAKINGKGPYRFFLDSGSNTTIIDTALAEALGLDMNQSRTQRSTAAGSRVTIAPIRGGVNLSIAPGLDLHIDSALAAPFADTAYTMVGERYDGILGASFFEKFVVEIDYIKRVATLHEPSTYCYSGDGAVLDIHYRADAHRLPFITVSLTNSDHTLDGLSILIDSGGQTMATASVSTRNEWDALITSDDIVIQALGATGLSNDAKGTTHDLRMAQLDQLTIGPYTFEKPVVSYSSGGPSFAVMGASLLHRFTTIYDYSNNRLIIEPNANFDAPKLVDRSGIMLVMADQPTGAFEVWYVADGTPGAEVGFEAGDVITAIDGVSTKQLKLNDARALFSKTKEYNVQVLRDGEQIEVILPTRDLFEQY